MRQSKAIIVNKNEAALRSAAASARISTQQGTALEIYDKSLGDERDIRLLHKVLSSGHKSVIEHQTLTVAFNDVSVLVEQFVIECRLASFTVKSRRYVDFGAAGWVVPEGLSEAQRALYDGAMSSRFEDYRQLMALGVPKEDARFVLPYCLRSNFFMTLNARELMSLIGAMLKGRGAGFCEIESLGRQLKAQFEALIPGVIDRELEHYPRFEPVPLPDSIQTSTDHVGCAEILMAPKNARQVIREMCAFTGRPDDLPALLTDARPRELEMASYTFKIHGASLSCVTHFTRHRIASLLVPPVARGLSDGGFVLPETVRAIPEAEAIYRRAFEAQAEAARRMNTPMQVLSYFALSGHQIDLVLSMNLRQIIHFMRLRTCRRAQWEIRDLAWDMLNALRDIEHEIFEGIGPSCVYGPCPEGRMSCGQPYRTTWTMH